MMKSLVIIFFAIHFITGTGGEKDLDFKQPGAGSKAGLQNIVSSSKFKTKSAKRDDVLIDGAQRMVEDLPSLVPSRMQMKLKSKSAKGRKQDDEYVPTLFFGQNTDCSKKASGFYPDEEDCSKFHRCYEGVLYSFICPTKLLFDHTDRVCKDASLAKCYRS